MESMSRSESLSFDIWCAAFAASRAALCDAARGELVDRLRAYRGPWLGDGIHENVHRDELLAALAQEEPPPPAPEASSAVTPRGWVPVPLEPTANMLLAADRDVLASCETGLDEYRAIYRAMLVARPAAEKAQ